LPSPAILALSVWLVKKEELPNTIDLDLETTESINKLL